MSKKKENTGFVCLNCGKSVPPAKGGYRNHCPFCLYSLHADISPGDRQNDCLGLMRPVGIETHSKKGIQIVHECQKCGERRLNMISDCSAVPDNMDIIYEIMKKA